MNTGVRREKGVIDEMNAMIERLRADGPTPEHRDDLMLFGELVGSWDIEMVSIDPDGNRRRYLAEWHFGWTLQGRSVQDVLITRTGNGDVVGYGSTVRSFDAKRGLWWIVWQDPLAGEFSVLFATREDDRIVLQGQWTLGDAGRRFRWTFSDITPESFRWECHIEDDAGDWRLVEEMQAIRHRPAASRTSGITSDASKRAWSSP